MYPRSQGESSDKFQGGKLRGLFQDFEHIFGNNGFEKFRSKVKEILLKSLEQYATQVLSKRNGISFKFFSQWNYIALFEDQELLNFVEQVINVFEKHYPKSFHSDVFDEFWDLFDTFTFNMVYPLLVHLIKGGNLSYREKFESILNRIFRDNCDLLIEKFVYYMEEIFTIEERNAIYRLADYRYLPTPILRDFMLKGEEKALQVMKAHLVYFIVESIDFHAPKSSNKHGFLEYLKNLFVGSDISDILEKFKTIESDDFSILLLHLRVIIFERDYNRLLLLLHDVVKQDKRHDTDLFAFRLFKDPSFFIKIYNISYEEERPNSVIEMLSALSYEKGIDLKTIDFIVSEVQKTLSTDELASIFKKIKIAPEEYSLSNIAKSIVVKSSKEELKLLGEKLRKNEFLRDSVLDFIIDTI